MAARSTVDLLPAKVREELNRRLEKSAFSNYDGLTAWLKSEGFNISRSAVHRYGQAFEDRLSSLRRVTEQARIIVAENPDDDGSVNDALIRLVQDKLFDLITSPEFEAGNLKFEKIGRVIADLARASISQKRLAREIREEMASQAEDVVKEMGLSAERAAELRRKLLGVKPKAVQAADAD